MADISAFLEQIRKAPRGETVRDSIVSAIRAMGEKGITAQTLSGLKASSFASYKDLANVFITGKLKGQRVYDSSLSETSTKTPDGDCLYTELKYIHEAFNSVLDIEEKWE